MRHLRWIPSYPPYWPNVRIPPYCKSSSKVRWHSVVSAALPVRADAKVAEAGAGPGGGHLLLLVGGVDHQVGRDEGAPASAPPQQWALHPGRVVAATLLALHTWGKFHFILNTGLSYLRCGIFRDPLSSNPGIE